MNRVMGESNTKLFLGFNVPGLILRSPSKQLGRFFRSKLKTGNAIFSDIVKHLEMSEIQNVV